MCVAQEDDAGHLIIALAMMVIQETFASSQYAMELAATLHPSVQLVERVPLQTIAVASLIGVDHNVSSPHAMVLTHPILQASALVMEYARFLTIATVYPLSGQVLLVKFQFAA